MKTSAKEMRLLIVRLSVNLPFYSPLLLTLQVPTPFVTRRTKFASARLWIRVGLGHFFQKKKKLQILHVACIQREVSVYFLSLWRESGCTEEGTHLEKSSAYLSGSEWAPKHKRKRMEKEKKDTLFRERHRTKECTVYSSV